MKNLFGIIVFCYGLALAGPVAAQELSAFEPEDAPQIAHETSQTRSFAQYEWDRVQDRIVRRVYSVFDPLALETLDLRWIADEPSPDRASGITGQGLLVWRAPSDSAQGKPTVVATLRGTFENGRASGYGDFTHISGLRYQGGWSGGVMEGKGLLLLPDGTQYVGGFENGKASGYGLRTDVFGNVLDGTFAAGLANGPGTRRPKGTRAYKATWADNKELDGSRKPISGDAGLAHVTRAAGQVYPDVEVGVNVSQPIPMENGEPAFLPYIVARTPQAAQIQPDDARLMGAWRGNMNIRRQRFISQTRSFAGSRERYGPIPMIITIANRGAQPLRVVGAYLDMQFSESDRRPAFALSNGADAMCGSGVSTDFTLENYGWGAAETAVAELLFVDEGDNPASRSFAADLGTVTEKAVVDFGPVIESLGVNLPYLRQNPFVCAQGEDCLAKARASGHFGALAPALKRNGLSFEVEGKGAVRFSWQTANGEVKKGQAPFAADFIIGTIRNMAECGSGAPTRPIMSNILTLPADSGPQPIPLGIRQDIAAGTVARLSLNMAATMTSNHRFQIVLQLSDGREAASIPIEMLYFTPNHWDTP